MNKVIIKNLLSNYLTGNLSPFQKNQLADLLNQQKYQEDLKYLIKEDFINDTYLSEGNMELRTAIQNCLTNEITRKAQTSHKLFWLVRLSVAASIILFLITASLIFIFRKSNTQNREVASTINQGIKDIPPGKIGAVLTLSNGSKIILDSSRGSVGLQGSSQLINKNGQLSYSVAKSNNENVYNTMSTPVGRQYRLILADGSKVWLNAASSITYPSSFSGNERRVNITGEAYFEVVYDKGKPFHVAVNGIDVEVLGTHFNINCFDNEPSIKTTLLEGSVKVTKGNSSILISPGEQAVNLNSSKESAFVKKAVELDQVMAWKNGKFIFQDDDIKSIMRQLERWYDVTASYSENVTNEEFVGVISTNVNISQILNMLEKTGKVNFTIKDRNIFVK